MSKTLPVILLGGGGHGSVLFDILSQLGIETLGICDPCLPVGTHERLGIPILGSDEVVMEYRPSELLLVNGVGSVAHTGNRQEVFERFGSSGYNFATLTHPSAIISADVSLGEGAQIMAGTVIQTGAVIGANALVNTSASIDHDCIIGHHVHIAPGSVLSGGVVVDEGVHIGTGARIKQGVRIGPNALIGAGVTVLSDVPAGTRVHPAETLVWTA